MGRSVMHTRIGHFIKHLFRLAWYNRQNFKQVECTRCEGAGYIDVHTDKPDITMTGNSISCPYCQGVGVLTIPVTTDVNDVI